jgi:spore coat protein U-like protein
MKKLALFLKIFICLLTLSVPAVAKATAVTANLNIAVTVDSACSVSTTALGFTSYAPLSIHATSPDDGTGVVTLICTTGTVATLGLGGGLYAAGGQPYLSDGSGAHFIPYTLYQDSSHSIIWGMNGNAMILAAAPNSNERAFTVYGRIPAALSVGGGSYTDTVLVSVNF